MNFHVIFLATITAIAAAGAQSKVVPYDTAILKYKPQLKIEEGCHPYPAVQKDGAVGSGLSWSGPDNIGCKGSPLGSQVYARSTWLKGKWAVMYAWYFPKGRAPIPAPRSYGHRHGWEYAESPTPKEYLDGNSLKVAYYFNGDSINTAVKYTVDAGEFQDLIMWDQLSGLARDALVNTDWDETPFNVARVKMPMKDGVFMEKLNGAYPF
ncbi:Necrosis inducing protein [Phytophthora cactorum]|nr:Necrosis inducing protein [Phytophthora cactorum]